MSMDTAVATGVPSDPVDTGVAAGAISEPAQTDVASGGVSDATPPPQLEESMEIDREENAQVGLHHK